MGEIDHYKHGTMDTTVQEKTFAGFLKTVQWMAILIVLFLIFLAIFNG